ncbi:LysR family transcriptional regulator [Pseudomonas gingeri]|uniref:helix-turn-helix domain-containing protein n=1 Tax=Pseudomonas gingeri TaxID=117681 RepID=UPI0015A42DD5|nr:LysR family transcriptional regulator [Pseudomonas gingeri]NWD71744.1 LysR family transcriptional regulator [Pseudomonas gingeri]
MLINEKPFLDLDLNLLLVFLIIFRERSLTRTAQLLDVTQPAVSGSLLRLRQHFDDPLFIRLRGRMEPTAKSMKVAQVLLPAMLQIEAVLNMSVAARPRTLEVKEVKG